MSMPPPNVQIVELLFTVVLEVGLCLNSAWCVNLCAVFVQECVFNPILTPISAILENHPISSSLGILCRHMLRSRLLLSLKQRGCNAIWVCPPLPLTDFPLLHVVTSAQFPLEVCAAVTLRGKENFQGSSTPCSYFSSSLQPLPTSLSPSVHCWKPGGFPRGSSQLPA